MTRFQYVILSHAEPGEKAVFDAWYDGTHLADVVRVPGVVGARRYPILRSTCETHSLPAWTSLAIYEIESDDPEAVIAAITAVSGSEAMPISDSISMSGLVQILAGPETGRA